MAYITKIPKLNLEMQEGTIVKWYVDEGDAVSEGDPIADVEAEKANAEITAEEDGVVQEIFTREGDVGEPGDPIAIVAGTDEDISDLIAEVDEKTAQEEPGATESEPDSASEPSQTDAATAGGRSTGDRKVTPKARKRASELGVDLDAVEGTGYEGAVTADDVERAASQGDDFRSKPHTVTDEQELVGMRKTIADRLSESYRDAVHVTVHREVNVAPLLAAVDDVNAAGDTAISLVDVLLKALSNTLGNHPEFNGTFEDGTHRYVAEHHIAFAVDIDEGLITPVIASVDEKSLSEITDTRTELTEQAQAGEYDSKMLSDGTFTITNLGPLGVDSFTPIINPPQVAILGINRYKDRPVPTDDGVSFEPYMTLDLTFDHRLVDGADGARFLDTLAAQIADSDRLVVDAS